MELETENNIVVERKLGRHMRTFTLNEESKAAKLLLEFYDELKKAVSKD